MWAKATQRVRSARSRLAQMDRTSCLAISAGLMIVAAAFLGVGVPELAGTHTSLTHNGWTLWGGLLLILGAGLFLVGAIGWIASALENRNTPLLLSHDPTDQPGCLEWSEDGNGVFQQVRIKVSAKPTRSAYNVKLNMLRRSPQGRTDFMHLMHDNAEDRPLSKQGLDCNVDEPRYFDVAVHRPGKNSVIEFADRSVRNLSAIDPQTYPASHFFTFRAVGRRSDGSSKAIAPAEQSFRLNIASNGELSLCAISNDEIAAALESQQTVPATPIYSALSVPPSAASGATGAPFAAPLMTREPASATGTAEPLDAGLLEADATTQRQDNDTRHPTQEARMCGDSDPDTGQLDS